MMLQNHRQRLEEMAKRHEEEMYGRLQSFRVWVLCVRSTRFARTYRNRLGRGEYTFSVSSQFTDVPTPTSTTFDPLPETRARSVPLLRQRRAYN